MLDYRYKACEQGIKEQVVDMVGNGCGIRDTVRVLNVDKNTVISTLYGVAGGKGDIKQSVHTYVPIRMRGNPKQNRML